ncbi:hypothetical protein P8452_41148 [Trifolium repens]|nr:hypothetical protein P8452_41148 [Trifolium repens]
MPIKTFKEAVTMVIKVQIKDFCILRVSVNPTSKADILYWPLFLKMELSESMLKPCEESHLKGVIREGVTVKGYIDLDTIIGEGMISVRYLVVDSPSPYNIVIGHPALKSLKAFIRLPNLTLEYPIQSQDGEVGVCLVEADLEMAKKCVMCLPTVCRIA